MYGKRACILSLIALFLLAGSAGAKVTNEQAAQLRSTLTPFGSERAANADGTIPEWTGERIQPPAGWKAPNGHRPDPFTEDKIFFTITAENFEQYVDKLSPGQKAMFETYPDSYKMNIYQSRRTHALPDEINQGTFQNATAVDMIDNGNGISESAVPGTPFPIPQSGLEVMWNHMLRFQGVYQSIHLSAIEVQPNGKISLTQKALMDNLFHYYYKDGIKGRQRNFAWTVTAPNRWAGDGILALDSINAAKEPRKAWMYSAGERRVRRAPTLNFDSPDYSTTTYDDFELYNGSPERYDWKLIGKQEMYIPYNNYKCALPEISYKEMHTARHPNPKHLRYELHRVWVVEANLKESARHIYAKRVFFFDEDSWNCVATDKYDGGGKLWRTSQAYLKNFYDIPMTNYTFFVHTDLKNGVYLSFGLANEEKTSWDFSKQIPKESYFTPQALRRRGR